MTHPENGRFTRTIVNRIWHRLMGRGIVHPVDAMHTKPWNDDLLDFLAVHLADNRYDLKKTIELICNSAAYQSAIPSRESAPDDGEFVFRGPTVRRMSAEQFVDAVWQLTGTAPNQFHAPVVRMKSSPQSPDEKSTPLQAKWIWSTANSASAKAGETISVRTSFEITGQPTRSVAALTCDNEYTLYVNGRKVQADANWESVELVGLDAHIRPGRNEILIVAKNGGSTPNAAGLIFEARIRRADKSETIVATDATWEWTVSQPDGRGRFAKTPDDWKKTALVAQPGVWAGRVNPQLTALLNRAAHSNAGMVRASLLKSDYLMRSLGRPNRDQIVTMRPSGLTTLEAIDLANGQILADAIANGAKRVAAEHRDPQELANWVFASALSRSPSDDEQKLLVELLGMESSEQGVQDLLWAVFMLPEFQLIR